MRHELSSLFALLKYSKCRRALFSTKSFPLFFPSPARARRNVVGQQMFPHFAQIYCICIFKMLPHPACPKCCRFLSEPHPLPRLFLALLGSRRNVVSQNGISKMLPRHAFPKCCRVLSQPHAFPQLWSALLGCFRNVVGQCHCLTSYGPTATHTSCIHLAIVLLLLISILL